MGDAVNTGVAGDEPVIDERGFLLPHLRYDYAGRCWWCGRPADSREHRHKKNEVKRHFGPGPYTGDNAVVRGVLGQETHVQVQGPDSVQLKFERVLCSACNSARSQNADKAYDAFSGYVADHSDQLLRARRFRWSDVFPQDWRAGRDLVTAYWLKHIGCRLAEGGVQVPPQFGAYIDAPGDLWAVPVRLRLVICQHLVDVQQSLPPDMPKGSFWLGNLACNYSRSQRRVTSATSYCGQGWLHLWYCYDVRIKAGTATFWRKTVWLRRQRYVG